MAVAAGRQRRFVALGAFLLASLIVCAEGAEAVKLPKTLQSDLTKELVAIFEPGKLPMPADAGYPDLEYRLFKPRDESPPPPNGYPLILFFNGHGRIQMNYGDLGPLKHLQATIFAEGANFPYANASVQLLFDDIDPDALVSMLTARVRD